MRPSAGHSYLNSGCDDDGDGDEPQLDSGEAGACNIRHLPHVSRQKLHHVLILSRYRVACRIDALPLYQGYYAELRLPKPTRRGTSAGQPKRLTEWKAPYRQVAIASASDCETACANATDQRPQTSR